MEQKYLVYCYLIDDLFVKGFIGNREATIAKSKVLEEIRRCNESYTAEAA